MRFRPSFRWRSNRLCRGSGGLGLVTAQVGHDAAIPVAEHLGRVEGMRRVEAGDRRVQTAAGNDQQGKPRARLFIMNADITLFMERHG